MEEVSNTKLQLEIAVEKLFARKRELMVGRKQSPTASHAPRPADYFEDDPLIGELDSEWFEQIKPENDAVNQQILEILSALPAPDTEKAARLNADKVWLWGGPTPSWGGSMADDTLLRGADYFRAENVVYVYGPTTDKMMQMHSKYKKMLCQINANCRTTGALANTEEENAELLSRLSLKYKNIVGAMCDDYSTGFQRILLPERFEKMYSALKKHNSTLRLYGVIYTHELGHGKFPLIQPYIDVVNLWHWNKEEILNIDKHVALCQQDFPGKPILFGIFIHDYGCANCGSLPELLVYQLEKAREYTHKGIAEGIVILGDREIKKWPETALAVKKHLAL